MTRLEKRLIHRMAFMERDARETHRLIGILQTAGVITEEQLDAARGLILAARERNEAFLDVKVIEENFTQEFSK